MIFCPIPHHLCIWHCHLLCAALSSCTLNWSVLTLSFIKIIARRPNNIILLTSSLTAKKLTHFQKSSSLFPHMFLFVCLFGIFVPLENFSLIWRRHLYRWRASNLDLCLALMAMEQWGLFSTHCDTGHPFIMAISDDPRYFGTGAVTTCFNDF